MRRLPENGNEALDESEAAEQQRGVKGVACESVPEKWQACKIASGQAGGGLWVGIQEPPGGEIGDQKELG